MTIGPQDPFQQILDLLEENKIEFKLEEHAPIVTSEEASAVRGRPMSEGAKSLVVKVGPTFVLAVVPGDRKLAARKLRQLKRERKLRFAHASEVEEKMGCSIGACYPIGNVCGLPVYADANLAKNSEIAFNPGRHDRTIVMKWSDYLSLVKPKVVDITQ